MIGLRLYGNFSVLKSITYFGISKVPFAIQQNMTQISGIRVRISWEAVLSVKVEVFVRHPYRNVD